MCFDKTGTLTEEGLDMYGVRALTYHSPTRIEFSRLQMESRNLGFRKKVKLSTIPEDETIYGEANPFTYIGDPEVVLKECMASCHSLTRVKGELIGDPLEVKMFEATKWVLIENNQGEELSFDGLILAIV